MQTSPEIAALAEALSKAQGQIEGASKDATNPHFGKKYADLASVWEACRGALSKHGLAVIQLPGEPKGTEAGGWLIPVTTMLTHSSGQWVSEVLYIPTVNKSDAQGFVGAVTYARRCALAAFVGVAPEDDDDGERAVGRGVEQEGDYIPCSQPGCKYRASYQEGEKWFCGTHRSNRPPNAPRGTGTGPSKGGNAFQKAQDASGQPNGPKLVETPERRFKRLLVALREVGWGEPLLVENSVEGAMARSILLQELLDGEAKARVVPNKLLDGDWIEAADKLDAILKEQVGEPA